MPPLRKTESQLLGHRLFMAILPPADVAARIGEVRDCLGQRGHVSDDRLHITMALLDDWASVPAWLLDAAREALHRIAAAPLQIMLDRVVTSGRMSALVPEETSFAMRALGAQMAAALASVGLPLRHDWKFRPHMTLLYNAREPRSEAIMPISWRAEEVVLIHSLVGLTRHIVIDRAPLNR